MKTRYSRWIVALALCALGMPSVSFAQVVTSLNFIKAMDFEQTSASTLTSTGASFSTFVSGFSLSAPVLTVPSGTKAGSISFGSGSLNSWQYRDASFADMSAVISAYGPGYYTVAIGGGTVSTLGFPTGVFLPNTPLASLSSGFWSGGEFFADVANSLTISANLFTTNYSASHGAVQLQIHSFGGEPVANFYLMSNQLIPSYLPAFSLTAGQSYDVNLTFYTFVNPATTGPDSFASIGDASRPHTSFLATYAEDTHFVLHAFASSSSPVPEPSTYGVAAVTILGVAAWLRRRRKGSQRRQCLTIGHARRVTVQIESIN